ncbi:hypothetical protein [Paraburkholderia sp.]|uniref:hypothetical protein n=1 Tax=Paraburkholderia sp. TaxID=1926495 RepID=UPI0039E40646
MNPSSIRSAESRRDSHGHEAITGDDARPWLIGLAVTAALLATLVGGAVIWTTPGAQVKARPCPNWHQSLDEAFFQDPADQSALLQSIQACSK